MLAMLLGNTALDGTFYFFQNGESYSNFFFLFETQLCGHVQMELVYSTAYHSYQSWSVLEVIWNNYFRPQILNKTKMKQWLN